MLKAFQIGTFGTAVTTRPFWDTTEETAKALDRASSAMRAVLLCLRALGQAQTILNGEEGAANIMRHWLGQALSLPLDHAELLARRLPIVAEEERRDRFWIDTRQALERACEMVEEVLDPDRPLVVRFEATGAQLIDGPGHHRAGAPTTGAGPASAPLRADPATRPSR